MSRPQRAREVWSPVAIEDALAQLNADITRGVDALAEAYSKYATLKNELEIATAEAYLAYSGAAHAKKAYSIVATRELRNRLTVADIAWNYAKSKSDALVNGNLKALQSMSASIRGAYETAGRGVA